VTEHFNILKFSSFRQVMRLHLPPHYELIEKVT